MSARGKILDTIGALQNSLTKTEKKNCDGDFISARSIEPMFFI